METSPTLLTPTRMDEMRSMFVFVVIAILATAPAYGRRRLFRRRQTRTTTYAVNVWGESQTDQERCAAEAAYMASNYVYAHIGPNIGNFEGWGCGWSPSCGTCEPGYGMTLTGDASCQASNGMSSYCPSAKNSLSPSSGILMIRIISHPPRRP